MNEKLQKPGGQAGTDCKSHVKRQRYSKLLSPETILWRRLGIRQLSDGVVERRRRG